MMKLNILHVSDTHLSLAKFKDFEFVKNALLQDATIQFAQRQPNLLIFSGDLVHAGGKDDDFYMVHEKLIEPLLKQFNIPTNRFFIVAGNHDIDRDEVRNDPISEEGQFSSLSSRESLNSFIDQHIKKQDDGFYFKRLNNFQEYRRIAMECECVRDTRFFSTHILSIDGSTVGIACLNSAWRCSGEENRDYGRLLIGERSVSEASHDLEGCDVKIAVFHHPLT
jgi:predicted MPP superfamily phosphohydrolase